MDQGLGLFSAPMVWSNSDLNFRSMFTESGGFLDLTNTDFMQEDHEEREVQAVQGIHSGSPFSDDESSLSGESAAVAVKTVPSHEGFFRFFGRNEKSRSCLKTLQALLRKYPELAFFAESEDGRLELCFDRARLVQRLYREEPDLIFTSLERGLKHSGLVVSRSSHRGNRFKKWMKDKQEREAQRKNDSLHLKSSIQKRSKRLDMKKRKHWI
jgi:hypothetical protein